MAEFLLRQLQRSLYLPLNYPCIPKALNLLQYPFLGLSTALEIQKQTSCQVIFFLFWQGNVSKRSEAFVQFIKSQFKGKKSIKRTDPF